MRTFGSFYDFASHTCLSLLTGCVIIWDINQNRLPSICLEISAKCVRSYPVLFRICSFEVFGVSRPVIFSPLNGPICVQPYILLRKSIAVQIRSTIVRRQISLYPIFTCEFIRGLHIHIYTQLHHRIEQVFYISLSLA